MKKCASCQKDLPDAALHCVFCGAKQAPASSQPQAKTMMGYQATDMIEQLRQQGAGGRPASAPPPTNLPAAAPYSARPAAPGYPPSGGPSNQAANAPTMIAPALGQPGGPAGYPQPAAGSPPAGAGYPATPAGYPQPAAGSPPASAGYPAAPAGYPATPAGGGHAAPSGGYAAPSAPAGSGYPAPPAGYGQPGPGAVAQASPRPVAAPIPSVTPAYRSSAARSGRPIEPWKDTLRLMMFVWGGLLLAAFATPVSLEPLAFNWDMILNGEGTAKLPALVIAAVGLLSIVVAAIPMTPGPRGMIAALLGLAGIFVPVLLHGVPPWQALVSMIGIIVLVPSLLVRHEYRDATVPRILITLGAVGALLPMVLPTNGVVPLVELFKAVLDAPMSGKIIIGLMLAQVALIVLSLLAWLPSPSSGGAKPLAWLLMIWPLFLHAALLFLVGQPEMVTRTPFAGAMSWLVTGAAGLGGQDSGMMTMLVAGAGIGVGYFMILGYGGATVIGKNLE